MDTTSPSARQILAALEAHMPSALQSWVEAHEDHVDWVVQVQAILQTRLSLHAWHPIKGVRQSFAMWNKLPPNLYAHLVEILRENGSLVCDDATIEALKKYRTTVVLTDEQIKNLSCLFQFKVYGSPGKQYVQIQGIHTRAYPLCLLVCALENRNDPYRKARYGSPSWTECQSEIENRLLFELGQLFSSGDLVTTEILTWEPARRLIWRDRKGLLFRVAEDGSYADVNDDPVLGIVPPIQIWDTVQSPLSVQRAWQNLLNDYRILQPFPQVALRAWRTCEEAEASVAEWRANYLNRVLEPDLWHALSRLGEYYKFPVKNDAGQMVENNPITFDSVQSQRLESLGLPIYIDDIKDRKMQYYLRTLAELFE